MKTIKSLGVVGPILTAVVSLHAFGSDSTLEFTVNKVGGNCRRVVRPQDAGVIPLEINYVHDLVGKDPCFRGDADQVMAEIFRSDGVIDLHGDEGCRVRRVNLRKTALYFECELQTLDSPYSLTVRKCGSESDERQRTKVDYCVEAKK